MKIIREITFQEMLRRFAVGEVFSNFYQAPNNEHRKETLQLLESGEQSQENKVLGESLWDYRRKGLSQLPKAIKDLCLYIFVVWMSSPVQYVKVKLRLS